MSITTVNGTIVDCHVCRTSTLPFPTVEAAHAHAQGHAWNHSVEPIGRSAPVQQIVVQSGPHRAKTTINHTPHLILDLISFGLWIPVHITLAILGGRKTTFR